jgi:hypothetical protein
MLASGLALDPFVAVQDHLRAEGRIAAHADDHVTPVRIHQVEMVVLDMRPLLAMAYLDDSVVRIAFDFPQRRRRVAGDHEEQALVLRITGQARLGQCVFALPGLRLDDLDSLDRSRKDFNA